MTFQSHIKIGKHIEIVQYNTQFDGTWRVKPVFLHCSLVGHMRHGFHPTWGCFSTEYPNFCLIIVAVLSCTPE